MTEAHEQRGRLATASDALTYMLGGRARFTLVSEKTGTRYTYRVKRAEQKAAETSPPLHFVSLLTGPDNGSDYQYIGYMRCEGHTYTSDTAHTLWRLHAGAKGNPQHPAYKALDWTLRHLSRGTLPEQLEIWHEGRCCRCGHVLTVPASIASGIGPECAKKQD